MNINNLNITNVEGLQTSLRYLSFEAEGAGLFEVASMLKLAAHRCDQSEVGQKPAEDFVDNETIKAIDFLFVFYASSKASQNCFLEYVDNMSHWLALKVKTPNKTFSRFNADS
jgi:hypothetical protein